MRDLFARPILQRRRLRPLRRALFRMLKWRHRGVFSIDIDNGYSGFFAQLNWCLYVFAYCQRKGLTPSIRLLGWQYANRAGQDWLHDYFEDVVPSKTLPRDRSEPRPLKINHIEQTDLGETAGPMTLERANGLMTAYLRVRSSIVDHVNAFVENHFAPGGTLGVHFRGNDKSLEADPVRRENFADAIDRYRAVHPAVGVMFVASDDAAFIQWIAERYVGRLRVIHHADREVSDGNLPIHLNPEGDRGLKGFEALVNCLLLSRCDALLRSASFLSGWSNVFNPGLPVTLLNRPHEAAMWFPDSEVWKRSDRSFLTGP